MYWQAYCHAIYILGSRYHSGQWSKGYRLMWMSRKEMHSLKPYTPTKEYRKAIAFWLWKLKQHRKEL